MREPSNSSRRPTLARFASSASTIPPTALSTYNLACLKLREGHRDDALRLLHDAVDHGPRRMGHQSACPTTPTSSPSQGDPRFTALIAYATTRTAPSGK